MINRPSKKLVPFEFVLDELESLSPYTKPMFGGTAVYVDGKILFLLRERPATPEDNGIWIATTPEHHQSLRELFSNMRSMQMFGPRPTGWQVLPLDADDFEESALKACELVLKNDPRIGKVPKAKLKKEIAKKPK